MSQTMAVVTGGCGFIGSHLVRRLRERGTFVIVLDSLEYGRRENLDVNDPGIRIEKFKLGVDNTADIRDLVRGAEFLFHLAAVKSNQGVYSSEVLQNINVEGTEQVIKLAASVGIKKIVFTSSLYVYGRMTAPPMVETERLNPTNDYGFSKMDAEQVCARLSNQTGIPITCLRLFFTYGPRQYAGLGYRTVIRKNFERLLRGENPVIYGDGNQVFDYIYVDDVVSALIQAAETQTQFKICNVGSGIPTTINDLTSVMMDIANIQVKQVEYRPADWTVGSFRIADTAKFEHFMGTKSRVTLEEGLLRTYQWMRDFRA